MAPPSAGTAQAWRSELPFMRTAFTTSPQSGDFTKTQTAPLPARQLAVNGQTSACFRFFRMRRMVPIACNLGQAFFILSGAGIIRMWRISTRSCPVSVVWCCWCLGSSASTSRHRSVSRFNFRWLSLTVNTESPPCSVTRAQIFLGKNSVARHDLSFQIHPLQQAKGGGNLVLTPPHRRVALDPTAVSGLGCRCAEAWTRCALEETGEIRESALAPSGNYGSAGHGPCGTGTVPKP